eukprot:Hpha_TRINITY_DN16534_c2_g2::TRINITY_DN16534_c2_g2_i1::g.133592::m.133592
MRLAFQSPRLAVWINGAGDVGQVRDGDGAVYQVQDLAGSGATGAVYKVTDPAGRVLAMKVMSKGRYVEAEVRALELLRHPNVVRLERAAIDPKFPQAFLFFEFIEGGQLCDFSADGELVGELWTEVEARRVLLDMAASVAHLHQNDVVH